MIRKRTIASLGGIGFSLFLLVFTFAMFRSANATAAPASTEPRGGSAPQSPAAVQQGFPFRVSGPNSAPPSLARPDGIDKERPLTNSTALSREFPTFRELASSDMARFTLTASEGRRGPGGFLWATYYSNDKERQTLSLAAWTKVGDFNLVVPINSPVTTFELTTIDNLRALTLMPSAQVVGGLGPRQAYFYRDGVIYSVHGEGFFSDTAFLAIVHGIIAEVMK